MILKPFLGVPLETIDRAQLSLKHAKVINFGVLSKARTLFAMKMPQLNCFQKEFTVIYVTFVVKQLKIQVKESHIMLAK